MGMDWKKMVSVFVNTEVEVEKEIKEEQTTDEVSEESLFEPLNVKTESDQIVGVFDETIYEQLASVVTENDLPGDDYLEFKNNLKKLSSYIPDENKLYKASFDSLDLDLPGLVSSLTHYIDVVQKEKDKFKNALTSAMDEKVGTKEELLNQIVDDRENLISQINELNAKVVELNSYEIEVKKELQEARTNLLVTEANFTVSADRLTGQLTTDKEKIETHLS